MNEFHSAAPAYMCDDDTQAIFPTSYSWGNWRYNWHLLLKVINGHFCVLDGLHSKKLIGTTYMIRKYMIRKYLDPNVVDGNRRWVIQCSIAVVCSSLILTPKPVALWQWGKKCRDTRKMLIPNVRQM
jgi:hypothetical protein